MGHVFLWRWATNSIQSWFGNITNLRRYHILAQTEILETLKNLTMEDILTILKKKVRNISPKLLVKVSKKIRLSSVTVDFLESLEVQASSTNDGFKVLKTVLKSRIPGEGNKELWAYPNVF